MVRRFRALWLGVAVLAAAMSVLALRASVIAFRRDDRWLTVVVQGGFSLTFLLYSLAAAVWLTTEVAMLIDLVNVYSPRPPTAVLAALGLTLLVTLGLVRMARGRLIADEEGVHFSTWLGRSTSSWSDLGGIEIRGSSAWSRRLVIVNTNQRPRMALFYDPVLYTPERAKQLVASVLACGPASTDSRSC